MWRRFAAALENDRGSVTAEFVVVLPAVMLVLSLIVGALFLATQRLVLTSAAGDIARFEARGDWDAGRARASSLPSGASASRYRTGALHCVVLSFAPGAGVLSSITLSATGCAARSDSADEG